MQALVTYYSRTGHTRKVGEEIAKALKCDAEEIVDTVDRSGPVGWLNAGRQASMRELTRLQPIQKDPSKYDIVIIGTPVWSFTISTPVRTYLVENKDKLPKIAAFITFDNVSFDKALREMGEACGKKPAPTLVIRSRDIKDGNYIDAVKKFADEVKGLW